MTLTDGAFVKQLAKQWDEQRPAAMPVRKTMPELFADLSVGLTELWKAGELYDPPRKEQVQRRNEGNDMSKRKSVWKVTGSTPTPEAVAKAATLTRERLKAELREVLRETTTPAERRKLNDRLTAEAKVAKGDRGSLDSTPERDFEVAALREVERDGRLLVEQRDGSVSRLGGDAVTKAKRADMSSVVTQPTWNGSQYSD